jgi:hypothetical protein
VEAGAEAGTEAGAEASDSPAEDTEEAGQENGALDDNPSSSEEPADDIVSENEE